MTAEQIRHARDLLTRPDNTVSSIARLLGVSRATIYKYVPEVTTGRQAVAPPHGQRRHIALKIPCHSTGVWCTWWGAVTVGDPEGSVQQCHLPQQVVAGPAEHEPLQEFDLADFAFDSAR